ncbi:hypothetical protein C3747_50g22 [Trypanosoma cruzi]|uniref:Secreted protein n=1 Tax=Trypanosoma cruzi TaxID=5693 RepID=A0A2V2WV95_TRYCR|nr:hypothetical protein C3747_50g22 [Trypanosoma cruzi]
MRGHRRTYIELTLRFTAHVFVAVTTAAPTTTAAGARNTATKRCMRGKCLRRAATRATTKRTGKGGEGHHHHCPPPPVVIPFPTTHSSSTMNDPPHMVAERQGPASEVAKGRKRRSGTPPTRSGCAFLVDHFTSAAAARPAGRQRPQGRQVARSGDGSVGAASAAVVTSTLLEKLRRNVLRKRLDWQQMPSRYPLVQRLPVWRQRFAWSALFALVGPPAAEWRQCHGYICMQRTGAEG